MSCSWLVVTAAILPTCRLCPKARVLRVTCSVAVATAAPMTSLPHCVVSVLRWCSWDGHKRTPSCSGNRIRRHDSSHSDCFTTPTSSELKWLFQINYADIQRIACRDRGAQRSLLDEVTLLVIPVTHVPEIGAENPNQKTGTVNWHAKLLEPGDGMRGVRHECVTKLWRPSFDSNCHPGPGKPRRLRNLAQM